MRSVWNGTIVFGSVQIPVRAYSATEERGTGLHQLHANDGGRIRLRRTCELDGAEVPVDELAKGYPLAGGEVVVLTDEELAGLPRSTTHTIDICSFSPMAQLDPIFFARSYHLEPDNDAVKPYALFAEALRRSDRVAVVRVALRQRETLAMLRVRDRVLVLTTMLWPDEVRAPEFPFLDQDVAVQLRELHSAAELVERLSTDFAPAEHSDDYSAALHALVNAKIDRGEVLRPSEPNQDAAATRLVETLRDKATGESDAGKAAVDKAKAAVRKAAAAKAAATRAANRAAAARQRDAAGSS